MPQVIIPTLAIQNPKRVAIDGKLHRLSSYGKKSVSRHKIPAIMPIRNNTQYVFVLLFIFMIDYLHSCYLTRFLKIYYHKHICVSKYLLNSSSALSYHKYFHSNQLLFYLEKYSFISYMF